MKKQILRGILAIFMAVAASGISYAQTPDQLPPLPADPALRTGVLDNGLSYYIRHNETPKGQADFYIAQKVGSILEDDHQRGLAHFLEHMCFNGTENFPEKGIINWLESVGVKFGANLNAYTSVDETVYNISNVPVARTSVQDSCLLILHDWSCALTLDPKEIDAERGVIHEEWRRSMAGTMRVLEQLLPVVYPDNRYGYRLPIGTMEVVDNFPPQAIIDYYHKWYRPDQQGIIVVGDIDVDYIEGKIKEIFSPIPMPENAAERVYYEVDETPGTIFALGKDKEIQSASFDLMFKTNALYLPREYRNSMIFYSIDYITNMIQLMLNARLDELSNKPETEYAGARASIGNFFLAKTTGALTIEFAAKDTDVIPAITQAYREALRAVRGGFTVGEYERARTEFLSNIEKQYEQRNDRQNESYSREYVRLFVDNYPAPGIEVEKGLYEQIAQALPLEAINQVLPQIVTDDNRVLLGLFPDTEGFFIPTEEQFAEALESVDDEEIEAYKDEMREDPLIPNLPAPGSVVATAHNDEWDATEFTLSNGVKVIVKPTDFKANQIVFNAIAKGKAGASLDPALASAVKLIQGDIALGVTSYYDYTNSDVKKYLQGKQVEVSGNFDDYTREVEGTSTIKDLPTAMEILYALFTGFNIKSDEFEALRSSMVGLLANIEANPQYVFQKNISNVLYKSPLKQAITLDDIKTASLDDINAIVRNMTANAADFTFVFAGSIDLESFIPLMEQYIATLPADAATVTNNITVNPDFSISAGSELSAFTTKMETPQTWTLVVASADMPYTPENKLVASVASQILSKRLLNKVREEMGATYSIGAYGDMSRVTSPNYFLQIPFPMKPEMKEEVLKAIEEMINEMTTNVTDEELQPTIEYMLKNNAEKLRENDAWTGAITATSLNGVNIFLNQADVLKSITTTTVQDFMKEVLKQGNYRVITLDAEE
ncbi:MAG: insulinase family protein [Muribaculaceae bacterium]|nr:insulinase family protein [Muribaculaceae bacterium]